TGESTSAATRPPHLSAAPPLSDRQRQPLYRAAFLLLDNLAAPPGVYLMQITVEPLQFDRLLPFPDRPAVASIGVQDPDLFTCHWHCLTGQPFTQPILTHTKFPEARS
ncbi:MAG: hypothetical protein HC918_07560, partial [Oscillatoriales cyanobacterium SM2_1_8]|nr:hypothetical protein [Oscillatoriales cyanobacterium SM2_1_8]